MNSQTRRIDKLEAIDRVGKQKPCKLIIYHIRDGVEILRSERDIPKNKYYSKHKQREDIIIEIIHVKPGENNETT